MKKQIEKKTDKKTDKKADKKTEKQTDPRRPEVSSPQHELREGRESLLEALNRRQILKLAGLTLGATFLTHCASKKTGDSEAVDAPEVTASESEGESVPSTGSPQTFRRTRITGDDGPIDRTLGDIAPLRFSGDDPDHSHQILWNVSGFIANRGGKVPAATEKAPLVIIGGGMSGLMSAYRLKKYVPIILEQADRFGGVSQGESWQGIDYSIGAAYFSQPKPGSLFDSLLRELDLQRHLKQVPAEGPVVYKGKMVSHFLKGDTDAALAAQGGVLERYFSDVIGGKNGQIYPDFPPMQKVEKERIDQLDTMSFRDHIKKVLGTESIHPHLETWFEHYSWSTFGASYREVSAAVGLYQMAAEFGKIVALPGGNAAIAEALVQKLKKAVGEQRLRPRSVVFQVKKAEDGVLVTYERDGQVRTIFAESVIFACPKFVVRKIFADLEPEREKVIRRLRYNAYLVANVLLRQPVKGSFYGVYLLGEGKVNGRDIQGSAEKARVTDVVNATYVKENSKNGILTLYRGLPYLGGRAQIYSAGAYLKYRKEFIDQIENEILPALGIPATAVAGVRMARWGHPMPVAQPGLISKGEAELLHKPVSNSIYFVNQDNWLNPCIEVAFGEAQKWAPIMEKDLEQRRFERQKKATS